MNWQFLGLLIGAALLAYLMVDVVFARFVALPLFERCPRFQVQASAPRPGAERIELCTKDGVTLRGSLYRQENEPVRGLILFFAETSSCHWSAMNYCEALWQSGFALISFDFRNQGESDHFPYYESIHWLTDHEVSDAFAILDYIDARDDLRELPLGAFGVSRGGCAVLAAAALRPQIRCVAVEGAYSTHSVSLMFAHRWLRLMIPGVDRFIPEWHIRTVLSFTYKFSEWRRHCRYTNLEQLLPRLRHRPLLLIAGGQDTFVDPGIPRRLCTLAGHATDSLWLVPEARHNMVRHTARHAFDRRLVEFFSQLEATDEPRAGVMGGPTRV